MNEYTKKTLLSILAIAAVIVCIVLVIAGQRNVGWNGLLMELGGLAGLIILLWLYNRKYQ